MEVKAVTKFARISPSKARDLARSVRGLPVAKALEIMQFSERKAAKLIGKTMKSAVANAENNEDLSVEDLFVKEAVIDEGPRLKRYWPRARGSVSRIKKRMCHIKIVLSDGETEAVEA